MKLPRFPRGDRSDEHPYGRFSWDRWAPLKWSATLVGLYVLDGVGGLVIGMVLGIELVLGGSSRRLLALAMPCFASVLLWNLWRGLPSQDSLSSLWVLDNPGAQQLAFAGFTFLVAGLLISPRPSAPPVAPGSARARAEPAPADPPKPASADPSADPPA